MMKNKTFSPKLDKISENIIYLLSINSRITVSDISKELKLNRKIVENRYNRLFNKGFIKLLTITNEKERLRFSILIKLNKFNSTPLKKITKLKGLLKIKETLGSYDFLILFDVYSEEDKEKIVNEISNQLSDSIISFDVINHNYEDTLGYKSFCHSTKLLLKYAPLIPHNIKLSNDEHKVLDLIKINPALSFVELTKKTKLSYSKLKNTINKFKDNNIVRFSIDPDYAKLGLEFHNIFLKIKPDKKEQFENYIQKHPRIHWIKKSLGRWSYILSVTATDINEFIDISKEIKTNNQDAILEESSLISKVNKKRKY